MPSPTVALQKLTFSEIGRLADIVCEIKLGVYQPKLSDTALLVAALARVTGLDGQRWMDIFEGGAAA